MEEPDVDDVHKHTFYEILWVDKGESVQTIDFKTFELGSKSLFIISPGQVHEFEQWKPLKGGTIMFSDTFYRFNHWEQSELSELSFLDNAYADPKISPGSSDYLEIRNTIDLLQREYVREDADQRILQSLLHYLLLQIQRAIDHLRQPASSQRYLVLYKQFKQLLEQNFSKAWSASQYASCLHITQHHLNRAAKEISGLTATDVIRQRTMLEAKRLLCYSDYSVSQISEALGFLDSSYFAKIFKKEAKMSPIQFKAQMSEKYRIK